MEGRYDIMVYEPSKEREWNEFVANARNSTFLFDRGYMDYHSCRFDDCSLMICQNGKLRALLPANISGENILCSHQGLTYGGLLLPHGHVDGEDVLRIFEWICDFCVGKGIRGLLYKPLPYIYASIPSQEDIYAMFRLGAVVDRCELSSALDLRDNPGFNTLMRRHLRKASGLTYEILATSLEGASGCLETDRMIVEDFHRLLSECLRERHEAEPVHTLEELTLLRERFPANIRIFLVRYEGEAVAGVCVYDTGIVAHTQYIASSIRGRELNLLPVLFDYLIKGPYSQRRYFDFGTSNEDAGRRLNPGLLRQKFSFGATGVAAQWYRLDF